MNKIHKNKIWTICAVVFALSLSVFFVLFALKNSIDLYYTPSDIVNKKVQSTSKEFRLGGMVMSGSLTYDKNSTRKYFKITDFKNSLEIYYDGIFPDLFKEKQGVVIKGKLLPNGKVAASEVLAKHDENYMPPNIKKMEF